MVAASAISVVGLQVEDAGVPAVVTRSRLPRAVDVSRDHFLQDAIAASTRQSYESALSKIKRPITTDTIVDAIHVEATQTQSFTGVKHKVSGLKALVVLATVDWRVVDLAHRAAYRRITDARVRPPCRDALEAGEMKAVIATVATPRLAFLFALQSLLCLCWQSLHGLRHEDRTVHESRRCTDVAVRAKKVRQEQGAHRVIRGFPFNVEDMSSVSARW